MGVAVSPRGKADGQRGLLRSLDDARDTSEVLRDDMDMLGLGSVDVELRLRLWMTVPPAITTGFSRSARNGSVGVVFLLLLPIARLSCDEDDDMVPGMPRSAPAALLMLLLRRRTCPSRPYPS